MSRNAALRLWRAGVLVGGHPHLLPDVRDHERRHGHACCRRGGGDCDRWNGWPRGNARADLRLLLNPARSIGPAIAAVNFDSLWLYVAAPLLGAALGALAYQFVRGEEPDAGIDHVEAEEARP
jgi:hypothetical protein